MKKFKIRLSDGYIYKHKVIHEDLSYITYLDSSKGQNITEPIISNKYFWNNNKEECIEYAKSLIHTQISSCNFILQDLKEKVNNLNKQL